MLERVWRKVNLLRLERIWLLWVRTLFILIILLVNILLITPTEKDYEEVAGDAIEEEGEAEY